MEMASAEDVGKKLLGEIEECGLDEVCCYALWRLEFFC
jgi:hypothetical protein